VSFCGESGAGFAEPLKDRSPIKGDESNCPNRAVEPALQSERGEFGGDICETGGLDVLTDPVTAGAAIDGKTSGGPQIQAGTMKALFRPCGESAFNIDGPKPATWDFENEVDFCSGGGAIETRHCERRRGGKEIFDDETLPAQSNDGMARECVEIGDAETPSLYLDLEAREDRLKLSEPALFLKQFEDRLVILDEIHRVPDLFPTLRGIIDQGRRKGLRTGRFLLLGSASMDLLRQSGESLAGRIAHVDLGPLDVLELQSPNRDLTPLWVRGGFPGSFLALDDRDSLTWRKDFVRSYLERELPLLGPRIPAETLEGLWIMLAHNQGGLLNASRLAASLMVSAQTVARYIDLLADLLLVRRLPPGQRTCGGGSSMHIIHDVDDLQGTGQRKAHPELGNERPS